MQILPNLDDYTLSPESTKCYLDGRYFDLVFSKYPGYISTPLRVFFNMDRNNMEQRIELLNFSYRDNPINIMRVIITTNTTRHSGVLIIDLKDGIGYYYDCSMTNNNNIILNLIENSLGIPIQLIPEKHDKEVNPDCDQSGFCVAYSIKYAYDFLNGRTFDPRHIRRWARKIEEHFGTLNPNNPDIEFGRLLPTIIGAGAGGLLGGTLGGSALIGAGIGGLGGYFLSDPNIRQSIGNYFNPYQ